MAVANVACLLGRSLTNNEEIIVLDWDLEAPGQHYYLAQKSKSLCSHPGLVELFTRVQDLLKGRHARRGNADGVLDQIVLSEFMVPTRAPNVKLMPAGRMDEDYQSRLTALDWKGIYSKCPTLYQAFAERLAQTYAAVLVDSRTGMTDTSNICTSLLPDKLVVVFTPNQQSLTGVEALIQQCTEYRRASSDLRALMVYPLPSRIDGQYEVLRREWRQGDKTKKLEGYEPQFSRILGYAYGLETCDLSTYFQEIQIQHSPEYSYGEPVVALDPESSDRLSLLRSYQSLVEWLCSSAAPWEDPQRGRDRKRLESLEKEITSEETIHSKRYFIDTLQEIFDLSLRLHGEQNLSTLRALQNLIEASLVDEGDRSRAMALLENLFRDFPTFSVKLRWIATECLLRSAAILRGVGDKGARSFLKDVKDLLEGDQDVFADSGLNAFISIADGLREQESLPESQFLLELVVKKLRNRRGKVQLQLDAYNSLVKTLRAAKDLSGAISTSMHIVRIIERERGDTNSDTVAALRDLANLCLLQENFAEAMKYQERVVEICRELFGSDAPTTLEAGKRLEEIARRLDQNASVELERAFRDYTTAMKAATKAGLNNVEVQMTLIRSLIRVGDIRSRQGDFGEALSNYLEANLLAGKLSETNDADDLPADLKILRSEIRLRIENVRLQTVAGGRLTKQ